MVQWGPETKPNNIEERREIIMTDLKVGVSVIVPVTDDDGEVSFVVGKLVSINSRFAKVDIGDSVVAVGKTKVELAVDEPEAEEKESGRIGTGYTYQTCTAASGRVSCDNGDKVAKALRGKNLSEAYAIVAETLTGGGDEEATKTLEMDLWAKYTHLNPGQQRMCLGNKLRGFFKKQK